MSGLQNASLSPADTPSALTALQELPLPEPVSWAPQTVGWLAVAAVLFLAALWVAWAGWRRHKKALYRKVALAELGRIETALHDESQRTNALTAIPALIKRTSLAAHPNEHVAALSGDEWLAFLKRTNGRFDERSGALLTLISYAPAEHIAALPKNEVNTLLLATRDWIQRHHVEI